MLTTLASYRSLYPDLATALIEFFSMENIRKEQGPSSPFRTVFEFISYYAESHPGARMQPQIVSRACDRLVEYDYMTCCRSGTISGGENQYVSVLKDKENLSNPAILRYMTCVIYGFAAVFDLYWRSILPLVYENRLGDLQIGTAFIATSRSLCTAWHCIEGAACISVGGLDAKALESAKIYRHPNLSCDLAIMIFAENIFSDRPVFYLDEAHVLDEVMAIGYPNIPGYHSTLTAEKASIASRLTASRGSIASKAEEIWTKTDSFLITARVKGGFSGGPLVDVRGSCVGIIVREPDSERVTTLTQYDNLGYGVAIPSSSLHELSTLIQEGKAVPESLVSLQFSDFR